jgi:hypothetical protein
VSANGQIFTYGDAVSFGAPKAKAPLTIVGIAIPD